MGTFVQFGAGNIGRSFIGLLFAGAGYEVVFIDVNPKIVELLNARHRYSVVVRETGHPDNIRWVEHVRAVDGRDREAVARELVRADYCATSVGQTALASVFPLLAEALVARRKAKSPPLDIIIAENLRYGAKIFHAELNRLLSDVRGWENGVGLVGTSIGKMVPLLPKDALEDDPLQLFTEPYETLIVDRAGFRNRIPELPGLKPVSNIEAYVDRKLFMHNMSHAAAAYLAWKSDPALIYLWQTMEIPSVVETLRRALSQACATLAAAYPGAFGTEDLADHAEDLLRRYRNRALGDTIHRVGRDLTRKLSYDDRLIGLCRLAAGAGLPFDAVTPAVRSALTFAATDEEGKLLATDVEFLEEVKRRGPRVALARVSGLDERTPMESAILDACLSDDD